MCGFGDPECQPLLMRLQSDLVELLLATAEGRLDELPPLDWDPRPAVCVVMASEGYPGNYERGQAIRGLEEAARLPDVKVFHAGTATVGWAGRNQRWPSVGRHGVGQIHSSRQTAGLYGRQSHSLERGLVPQGHFRQGPGDDLLVRGPLAFGRSTGDFRWTSRQVCSEATDRGVPAVCNPRSSSSPVDRLFPLALLRRGTNS